MYSVLITSNWFSLGRDLYYRKFKIYSMEWSHDIKLENFIVASGSYGGPLAIRRDETKILKAKGPGQPVISIFSASGKALTSFKWTHRPIVHMGWSNDEKLLCIQNDGNVTVFDMFGKLFHKFNIFQRAHDAKIIDAKIFTNTKNVTGIAVMTSNFNVFVVNSMKDIKTRQLSSAPKSTTEPSCWAVVSEDPYTEVLFARESELYRLKQDEHLTSTMLQPDISAPYTAILEMAVSVNARYLCFFTDSGHLWLGSTDLRHKYCEIDTNTIHRPKQLVWCGNEMVVVYWETDNTIMVVGKNGQTNTYMNESPVHLVPEIDGVRIVSNSQHELLQKVPEVVQKIFKINSIEPGSFLLAASKQFQKGSHKANEYLSLVKDIGEAVNQCLDAVGYEFDPEVQKMLIRAAQFGKCFVPGYNSEKYVRMCRLLRVLNAVRDPKCGIPLTIEQLKYMRTTDTQDDNNESLRHLLDRLIVRNLYFLALQVAQYLRLPQNIGTSYILVHWAKYKVGQHEAEEESVAREIAEKLGHASGVSYREIAEKASEYGKERLAIKLLDYEPKASEQVELLLKLNENKSALLKAIESGDTDLVYMVILKLIKKMPLGDFKIIIRNFPVAQALYIKYCKEHNKSALTEIYIQEDYFQAQAELILEEFLDDQKSHLRESLLTTALEDFRKGRNPSLLNASLCEENLRLFKFQRENDEKLNIETLGQSVHETCKTLLERKLWKVAEKFKGDFKIPDKRYWWLKINALAKNEEWTELDKFSKVKKSPVGYHPFVEACLTYKKRDEALKYLPKVSEEFKVKYCLKLGCYEEAAETAFQQRDVQGLASMQFRFSDRPELLQKVSAMISQLQYKK